VKPGPGGAWHASHTVLTFIPVSYYNDGNRPVRIVNETVSLVLPDRTVMFKWLNEVKIEEDCGENWLCAKDSVGPSTIPAQGTLARETMYEPLQANDLSWRDFAGFVCNSTGDSLQVNLIADVRATALLRTLERQPQITCNLDLKAMREDL